MLPVKVTDAEVVIIIIVVLTLADERGTFKWYICFSALMGQVNYEDSATVISYTRVLVGGNM